MRETNRRDATDADGTMQHLEEAIGIVNIAKQKQGKALLQCLLANSLYESVAKRLA